MSASNYVVCINNEGYEVSLEPRKIYRVLKDERARKSGQVRVIDESGEDYLFPAELFVSIKLPAAVAAHISNAA
jgi:hypothetical protein